MDIEDRLNQKSNNKWTLVLNKKKGKRKKRIPEKENYSWLQLEVFFQLNLTRLIETEFKNIDFGNDINANQDIKMYWNSI